MLLSINMRQFNARWRWNSDNAKYAEAITVNGGKFFTLDARPYQELLNEFCIFYTLVSHATRE